MIYKLIGITGFGEYMKLSGNNLVSLLFDFWNYEMAVYREDNNELIFSPYESNEFNSSLLNVYGLELIDGDKYRVFRDIKTNEVFEFPF